MGKARAALEARGLGRRHDGAGHDRQRDRAAGLPAASRAGRAARRASLRIQNHGIDGLVAAGVTTGFGDDWLRIGGMKLFADGSMGSGTAAFFEPYADDPSTSGLLIQSPAALEKAMFDADAAGFQLDRARDRRSRERRSCSTSSRSCSRRAAARDRRPRIEHAQVVRDAGQARFANARRDRVDSAEPLHRRHALGRKADRPRARGDRLQLQVVRRRRRAASSFGTDWFVEPLNPMLGLYAAVTRQFPDGTPPGGWFPEERITLAQAVEFYTAGSAYAEFAETRKGRLMPGYLADFVVLSKPSSTSPPREILDDDTRSRPSSAAASSTSAAEVSRHYTWHFTALPCTSHFPFALQQMDWPVVFRTHSDIEAQIVRGLLETHGIRLDSVDRAGAVRVPVQCRGAGRGARRRAAGSGGSGDADHRASTASTCPAASSCRSNGRSRPSSGGSATASAMSGLLEHALTHKSQGARRRDRRRGRQRVAGVPRRRRARLRRGRYAVSRVPALPRRAEVEGEGRARLDGGAGRAGAAHRARRVPAARAR